MDELHLLVSSASAPAIICLTETWLDDSVRACEVDLPNYRLFRRDRDQHRGGMAIFVLDTIPVHCIRPHSTYELLSVELSTKSGLLQLAVVYISPSHDTDLSLMELALGSLCLLKCNKIVLTGDFNIDTSDQSSNCTVELLSLMHSFGQHQQVSEPILVTASTATTLDLVFCNDLLLFDCVSVVSELGGSDHCSVFCSLSVDKPRSSKLKRSIWLYQKVDFASLNEALEASLPPEAVLEGGDVDITWPLFQTSFMDTVKRFIPSHIVSCKKTTPPWVTDVVRGAFRRRNRARRLAKSNTADAWHRFRKCRNKAVSAVRSARSDYFSSLQPQTDRSKKFWKSYHNLSSSTTKVPATISSGSSSASAPGDKSSLFNDYFATCFSVHDPNCSNHANATSHLAPLGVSSPPLAEITCDWTDVMKAIKHLRHNTASGPDGISATMPKGCCSSIGGRLARLFNNTSYSTGKIPSAWKISSVTPIHKKGDASLVQNYRPISLLSLVGKLQERLVHNLLLDHLLGRGAISPSQFGFRPGSSTQEVLLSATQTWHKYMEKGFSTVCVLWTHETVILIVSQSQTLYLPKRKRKRKRVWSAARKFACHRHPLHQRSARVRLPETKLMMVLNCF